MGWRSWNCYHGDVSQKAIEATIDAITDKSRGESLLDLGFSDVGVRNLQQQQQLPPSSPPASSVSARADLRASSISSRCRSTTAGRRAARGAS